MSSQTINIKFDKSSLPIWARKNPKVALKCQMDVAYRCDVQKLGSDPAWRKILIRQAG